MGERNVAFLFITDGRPSAKEAHRSARDKLPGDPFCQQVLVEDPHHVMGFAGAINNGWSKLDPDVEWIFHMEDDFIIQRHVPLERMIATLEKYPEIAQMSLKRQPVNPKEVEAGGIVELDPDSFEEQGSGLNTFTIHKKYWTTNPSVYQRHWTREGWPRTADSEGIFTHKILEIPLCCFGIWGGKFQEPWVEHVGERRGVGY